MNEAIYIPMEPPCEPCDAIYEDINEVLRSLFTQVQVTLGVSDWDNDTQTVAVNGVTATCPVIARPTGASRNDYVSAGVVCTAQGTDTLTFTKSGTVNSDLVVDVLIVREGGLE